MKKILCISLLLVLCFPMLKAQTVNGDTAGILNGITYPLAGGTAGQVPTCDGTGRVYLSLPTGVSSIFRKLGVDSIYYVVNGITHAIKDSTGGGTDLFKTVATNWYYNSDSAVLPVFNGGIGEQLKQTKYCIGAYLNAVYNQHSPTKSPAQVTWYFGGDSYGELLWTNNSDDFINKSGGNYAGLIFGGDQEGIIPITSTGLYQNALSSIPFRAPRYGEFPTGACYTLAPSGTSTWGEGGGAFTCTGIYVFYYKRSDPGYGGNFKLLVNGNPTSFTAVSTTGSGPGYCYIKQAPTSTILTITNNSASDSLDVMGVAMIDSLTNGIIVGHIGWGGWSIDSSIVHPTGITTLKLIMQLIPPTEYQINQTGHTDTSHYYAAQLAWFDSLSPRLKNADVTLFGINPSGINSDPGNKNV